MFLGPRRTLDSDAVARVKQWALRILELPEDVALLVTELQCSEPGCPPLETVIAVLDPPGQQRQFKIHQAINEVSFEDVERVIRNPQQQCGHHQGAN